MSINKVILLGNVGKEPEVRYLEGGVAVATFSLATTERGYKTQSGQQIPDRTEWHNVVVWRGLAEIVEKYVHKGAQLYVEGRIRTRSWEDQQGVRRYATEIYAENIELLGRRSEGQAQASTTTTVGAQPTAQPVQVEAQPIQQHPVNPISSVENSGDDLPF